MKPALAKKFRINISQNHQDIAAKPTVTIGIPVLNEEDHIERVVSGFLNSSYPNLIEILIADGGSTDRTREIVQELFQKDARVKLVENPEKFQSYGLNRMIHQAQGEVFLRADAHCDYGSDYIKQCIDCLKIPNVRNAGGAARFLAYNLVQTGTAIAVLSVLGNGGAKHYNPTYEGYSDTVPMGTFRTEDLRKLKGFTESNHTNEDAEINFRIQKELNGKIYISPDIKLWYYPRKSFTQLFRQYFRYGRGRFLTARMHGGKIPFRSKAPFIFVGLMILFLLVDRVFLEGILGSRYILSAALFILFFESIRLSFKEHGYLKAEVWKSSKKEAPHPTVIAIFSFFALLIMHLGHFSGYGYQMLKMSFNSKVKW
ncbi:MAG: glycosyltransferase family 2 protein [Balneolaceae bacterium]